MITANQLRAARALLNIDQRQTADLADLSVPTIQRMEASDGVVRGNVDSLMKLVSALENAGIELINPGVPVQPAAAASGCREHVTKPKMKTSGNQSCLRREPRAGSMIGGRSWSEFGQVFASDASSDGQPDSLSRKLLRYPPVRAAQADPAASPWE